MADQTKNRSLKTFVIPLVLTGLLLACSLTDSQQQQPNQNSDTQNQQPLNPQNQNQSPADQNQQTADDLEDPDRQQTHSDQWVLVDHGGFALWYDPAVIEDLQPITVSQSAGGMYEIPHPPYVQYTLPLDGGSISVVKIPWYIGMSETAAQLFPQLRNLIESQDANGLNCIPELPLLSAFQQCDHQQFNAGIGFVGFVNGSGVRFVSVYAIQDAVPVSNTDLVYVFQGITQDGQCYVQASFHLTHTDLDDFAEIPTDVYADTSGELLREYFTMFQQALDNNPSGYRPSLERFDLILDSIEVASCSGG